MVVVVVVVVVVVMVVVVVVVVVRSGQVNRSATGKPCKPVLPVHGTGCRRLNRLPHQPCAGEEGGMSPSRTKNKTCQRADELLRSQWPACNHK